MTLLRVTDDTTRDELVTALALLCADAKRSSRRGYIGTHNNAEYVRLHERMDALVDEVRGKA